MHTHLLNPNGGWCWFQDERALVIDDVLVFASVAGTDGNGAKAGDVQVTSVALDDFSEHSITTLAPEFQSDDHDAPALLRLADDRLAAFYQTHGNRATQADPTLMRWRITENPGDFTSWGPERTLALPGLISYANPFVLLAEGNRIYNFLRLSRSGEKPSDNNNNPHFAVSDDGGQSFRFGGRLLCWKPVAEDQKFTGVEGGRPYIQYASNGRDTIHFITSEDHPRAYDNSLYHGYVREGVIHASDGTRLEPLGADTDVGLDLRCLTRIFEGDANNVAWPVVFRLDTQGNPVALFSVQKDGAPSRTEQNPATGGMDHRYHIARWDGARWCHREIAFAGTCLYPQENDYTGLGALHPGDPSLVVVSTNAHPHTNEPLISRTDGKRHHELFMGRDPGEGGEWAWRPLTEHSETDQLRPVIPVRERGRDVLLWLSGDYRSWRDYDLRVMGAHLPTA